MIEILQYIMLLIVFVVVLRYIKKNNLSLSDLREREPKTDLEIKQKKEFLEFMKKEKNKLRY
ncbi:hypothetical protein [Aliarcobacter butzleri]|uniref:hypothetical protein n=1 Tax=Aliarcobacter butzleri TaxID=28197 RepID=UPI00214AEE7D|nr:hypothetical protein [Aliarcobacter butzleri]MCP3649700.1 hypothetical protein [Arcobacter sp. DNRA7]MCR1815873.1 hypothetical protein [Aliarcobacter butzleri]